MPPVPLREENYEANEGARSHYTTTVVMKTSISFSARFSVCGAIADLCNELSEDLRAPVRPAAPDHLEKMEIPTDLSIAEILPMHSSGET